MLISLLIISLAQPQRGRTGETAGAATYDIMQPQQYCAHNRHHHQLIARIFFPFSGYCQFHAALLFQNYSFVQKDQKMLATLLFKKMNTLLFFLISKFRF